jgi:hypothetical protein
MINNSRRKLLIHNKLRKTNKEKIRVLDEKREKDDVFFLDE